LIGVVVDGVNVQLPAGLVLGTAAVPAALAPAAVVPTATPAPSTVAAAIAA
jgi:hypothetical protein